MTDLNQTATVITSDQLNEATCAKAIENGAEPPSMLDCVAYGPYFISGLNDLMYNGERIGEPLFVEIDKQKKIVYFIFYSAFNERHGLKFDCIYDRSDMQLSAWIKRMGYDIEPGCEEIIASYMRYCFNNGEGVKGEIPEWVHTQWDEYLKVQ